MYVVPYVSISFWSYYRNSPASTIIIILPSLPNRFRSSISWPSSSPAVCHHAQFIWNRDFIIITLSLSWKSSGIRFEGRIQQLRERYFILYAISPSQENICDTFALMPSPAYLNRLRMDEKCWLLWHYCIFIFPLKLNSIWRDKCARKFGSTYTLFSRLRIVHDTFRIVVYVQATHCGFSSPKVCAHVSRSVWRIEIKVKIQPSGATGYTLNGMRILQSNSNPQ